MKKRKDSGKRKTNSVKDSKNRVFLYDEQRVHSKVEDMLLPVLTKLFKKNYDIAKLSCDTVFLDDSHPPLLSSAVKFQVSFKPKLIVLSSDGSILNVDGGNGDREGALRKWVEPLLLKNKGCRMEFFVAWTGDMETGREMTTLGKVTRVG